MLLGGWLYFTIHIYTNSVSKGKICLKWFICAASATPHLMRYKYIKDIVIISLEFMHILHMTRYQQQMHIHKYSIFSVAHQICCTFPCLICIQKLFTVYIIRQYILCAQKVFKHFSATLKITVRFSRISLFFGNTVHIKYTEYETMNCVYKMRLYVYMFVYIR